MSGPQAIEERVRGLARGAHYAVAQSAKTAWYTAQYFRTRHLAGPATAPGEVPKPYRSDLPTSAAVREAFLGLLSREAQDIRAGVYDLPRDLKAPPDLRRIAEQSRRYFTEAATITRRAHSKGGATEARDIVGFDSYPAYYRQNFHFQSDGWLTEGSADIYDTQVEALFTGAADAMRRRALPFILPEIAKVTAAGQTPVVADIGCGTGRLLRDVLDNASGVEAVAVDLSPAYLAKTAATIAPHEAQSLCAPAEALPFDDGSVDILFSVYLFHELPPKVRGQVAAEFARVLKPGGLYVHVDSVQYGDTSMDRMLESFPRAVHEPYYDGYCAEDLGALFGEAGFEAAGQDIGFLTKVNAYRRA